MHIASHEATPYKKSCESARKQARSCTRNPCARQEHPTRWWPWVRSGIVDRFCSFAVFGESNCKDCEATTKR